MSVLCVITSFGVVLSGGHGAAEIGPRVIDPGMILPTLCGDINIYTGTILAGVVSFITAGSMRMVRSLTNVVLCDLFGLLCLGVCWTVVGLWHYRWPEEFERWLVFSIPFFICASLKIAFICAGFFRRSEETANQINLKGILAFVAAVALLTAAWAKYH
jgi:hypothetical protein